MKGHIYTAANIYLINGIVDYIRKNGKTEFSTLHTHQRETIKSGKADYINRVRELARFARDLGLVHILDHSVELTDLGGRYADARSRDIWPLTKQQQQILRQYILERPQRNPMIFALTKLLKLTEEFSDTTILKTQFCSSIGKDEDWNSDVTKSEKLKFALNYLEELGLVTPGSTRVKITHLEKKDQTHYWTLFCNPATWQIDRFLEDHPNPVEDTYQINPWHQDEFAPGQLAVIRVVEDRRTTNQLGKSKRLTRGIYAVVEILSTWRPRTSGPDKYWLGWTNEALGKPQVRIRYLQNLISKPITIEQLKQDTEIKDNYLVNGFQASSMPLDPSTFHRICDIIGDSSTVFQNIETPSISKQYDIDKLTKKYSHAAPEVKEVVSNHIERGPFGDMVKSLYNHKCLACEAMLKDPYVFKKLNGELFIEAHHIIPVSERKSGTLGIDNLITLCPNHHRQFHFGDVDIQSNTKKQLTVSIDGMRYKISKHTTP